MLAGRFTPGQFTNQVQERFLEPRLLKALPEPLLQSPSRRAAVTAPVNLSPAQDARESKPKTMREGEPKTLTKPRKKRKTCLEMCN